MYHLAGLGAGAGTAFQVRHYECEHFRWAVAPAHDFVVWHTAGGAWGVGIVRCGGKRRKFRLRAFCFLGIFVGIVERWNVGTCGKSPGTEGYRRGCCPCFELAFLQGVDKIGYCDGSHDKKK